MSAPAEVLASRAEDVLDVDRVRKDFPILAEMAHGKPLAYLDNAASSQKPVQVIDAIAHYYRHQNANVHRGVHLLSERATEAYEGARERIRAFINARSTREVVFVRGTTEGINLVAQSFCRRFREGDEVLITHMEHHSNIVPWQQLQDQLGIVLKVAPITETGELDLEAFTNLLSERTRLVSVTHVSNALGTVNPVRRIIELAHERNIPVMLDGAQAVPHAAVDVQELDCEFYAFSGHKMVGPTGIGVLYAKESLLEEMPPYQGGGEMIKAVTFERTVYADLPHKFEAGTPNMAGAVGLGAAVDYLNGIGMDRIATYEQQLLDYGTQKLADVPGARIIGTARDKAAVLSVVLEGVHAHDIGTIVDRMGIAVRAGHHCAMPVMQFFKLAATARASLAFYNTREEIDRFCDALCYASEVLA